jgi:hypothetical protein
MIRAEMRGAAPLAVDGGIEAPERDARPAVGETTPDIPVVTRGLPVVERPDRR